MSKEDYISKHYISVMQAFSSFPEKKQKALFRFAEDYRSPKFGEADSGVWGLAPKEFDLMVCFFFQKEAKSSASRKVIHSPNIYRQGDTPCQ
jgi:hypothetical protein